MRFPNPRELALLTLFPLSSMLAVRATAQEARGGAWTRSAPEGWVPRDFGLEDWEKQAIVAFHLKIRWRATDG
jgi:hypothetical protein